MADMADMLGEVGLAGTVGMADILVEVDLLDTADMADEISTVQLVPAQIVSFAVQLSAPSTNFPLAIVRKGALFRSILLSPRVVLHVLLEAVGLETCQRVGLPLLVNLL